MKFKSTDEIVNKMLLGSCLLNVADDLLLIEECILDLDRLLLARGKGSCHRPLSLGSVTCLEYR